MYALVKNGRIISQISGQLCKRNGRHPDVFKGKLQVLLQLNTSYLF